MGPGERVASEAKPEDVVRRKATPMDLNTAAQFLETSQAMSRLADALTELTKQIGDDDGKVMRRPIAAIFIGLIDFNDEIFKRFPELEQAPDTP